MSEKSIEKRWTIWVCPPKGTEEGMWSSQETGPWRRDAAYARLGDPIPIDVMPVDDHLAALGEAEKKVEIIDGELSAALDDSAAFDRRLQTLRLALEAEVDRLRNSVLCNGGGMEPYLDGHAQAATEGADRLQALLDQPAETAGES